MPQLTTDTKYSTRQLLYSLLIILICCLISYWPVSTGMYSLKNDAVRYFLPVRFQVSEMINHGQFPYWTPFINLGHPLYTDMQSGVWNPFVWLISLFGNYTMRSLQAELLIYIYLSGVSMFFLLKHFKLNRTITLSLSICYMLCGFISDSTQFPYWICGLSFLPFIFLFFYKLLNELTFQSPAGFGFFMYLLFVTGYPGQFIIITYFLFAFFIAWVFNNRNKLSKTFLLLFSSTVIFCILSLPAILAYYSGLNNITRGGAIPYGMAMTNSLHPLSLTTYLLPLTGWKLPVPDNDILGRNSFFGLIPLFLLVLLFFIKTNNSLLKFLKWTFIISLLLTLGKYGGLRPVFYYLLPLMDTFRHPSIFRFLCIFSGIILAAFSFQYILENKISFAKKKSAFAVIAALLIISTIVIYFTSQQTSSGLFPGSFSISSLKKWIAESSAISWLFLELIIQSVFLFFIYKYLVKKQKIKIAAIASVLNVVIHTMLIQPVTVVSSQTVSSFQKTVNENLQAGFPLPDINSTINTNSNKDEKLFSEIGPVNMFNKKPGYQFQFVTPGPLITYEKFMNDEKLSGTLFNYPLFYRADTAMAYGEQLIFSQNKRFVLTDNTSLASQINNYKEDTNYSARLINFSPAEWKFEINASAPGFYCLIQNYYPDWHLEVNGKQEPVYLCNKSLIGIKLNAGKNFVRLQFRNPKVLIAFYIHLAALGLIIFYFIFLLLKRRTVK